MFDYKVKMVIRDTGLLSLKYSYDKDQRYSRSRLDFEISITISTNLDIENELSRLLEIFGFYNKAIVLELMLTSMDKNFPQFFNKFQPSHYSEI